MNLNEDGTITLSMKETQEYITRVINPKYKQLQRLRKWQKHALNSDLERIQNSLHTFQQTLTNYKKEYGNNFPKRIAANIDKKLDALLWCIEQAGIPNNPYSEEAMEIEKAFNLYSMLLKNRRFSHE